MAIKNYCADCGQDTGNRHKRPTDAPPMVCHPCRAIRRKNKPSSAMQSYYRLNPPIDKISQCEVCDTDVVTPAGARGTTRKRCAAHRLAKKRHCPACDQDAWMTSGTSKRCQSCVQNRIRIPRQPCSKRHCKEPSHAKGLCKSHYMTQYLRSNMGGSKAALLTAIQSKDYQAVITEVAKHADQQAGCWVWSNTNSNGYAQCRGRMLHRAVLEAKCQAPLGTQAAHHTCANRACVNPDHLQPVTHAENAAEMLHRAAYIRRIDELERVIATIAPGHPVLNRTPLTKAS